MRRSPGIKRSKSELVAELEQLRKQLHSSRPARRWAPSGLENHDARALTPAKAAGVEKLGDCPELCQIAIQLANLLVYQLTPGEGRLRVIRGLSEITGYALSEAKPDLNWWLEQVHPEDRPRVQETFLGAACEKGGFQIEYRLRTKEGLYRSVLDRATVMSGSDGSDPRIVGVVQDISGYRKSERSFATELQTVVHDYERTLEVHRGLEERLSLLTEASASLLGSLRLNVVLRGILDLSSRLIAADGYAVWRLQPIGKWQAVCATGISREYLEAGLPSMSRPLPDPDKPLILEDPDQEPLVAHRKAARKAEGIRSMLVMPLKIRGKATGTLAFYYRVPHRFSEVEVRLATALSNLASTAITTVELYEREAHLRAEAESAAKALAEKERDLSHFLSEQKRAERRLATQYAVTRALAEFSSLEGAASRILQAIGESLGWDMGALWRIDEEAKVLRCVECWHDPAIDLTAFEGITRQMSFEPGTGLPGRLWATAQPICIPDLSQDSSFPRAKFATQEGLCSAFGFPIILGEEVLGVVEFFSREMRAPDAELLQMISAVGSQIGQFLERKEAEKEILKLNQGLERRVEERTAALKEINEQMEAFSYSVSHDLRAPLRALQGFAEALVEDYSSQLDSMGQEYIRRISAAARHMDTLIQDILAYSRISRAEIEFRVVNLQNVVDEVFSAMAAEINARQAAIEVQRPLSAVIGHASTLKQVVINLLSNAIKFVDRGNRPQVRIWTEATGNKVRFWVQDNGIGIAEEHQERIFRVFERLHGIEIYPGTGIGLAIVRKGVERMGGSAGVESELGKGSRFWIELPAANPSALQ